MQVSAPVLKTSITNSQKINNVSYLTRDHLVTQAMTDIHSYITTIVILWGLF